MLALLTARSQKSFSKSVNLSGTLKKHFSTSLGWVGTGIMGSSMCSHLVKNGYKVKNLNLYDL